MTTKTLVLAFALVVSSLSSVAFAADCSSKVADYVNAHIATDWAGCSPVQPAQVSAEEQNRYSVISNCSGNGGFVDFSVRYSDDCSAVMAYYAVPASR